ncbi:MAG: glycogen synthase GlgA [Gammaproteobacteria bacterium]|nr:glycogen synthase GlgA [Gammaproteobacteria bacterium]MCF6230776.1 glycogen synthase GlgA [Gammaproteobacteria bacterium]
MNILYASSEAHPLIKTGGLADVAGSLPVAIKKLGHDIRLLLPAYHDVLAKCSELKEVAQLNLPTAQYPVKILQGKLTNSQVTLWLVDYPAAFNRPGNPYMTLQGEPWPDNPHRFTLLARAAVELSQNRAGLNWQADIVHCNDWQTALAPALLNLEPLRPATLFTIHNLAYQGIYKKEMFDALALPTDLWHPQGVEFHNQLNMIKGGIAYADIITTVSPTYAHEIQGSEYGNGLEGMLRHRGERLFGILNGVDYEEWNPEKDRYLAKRYSASHFESKTENKRALQQESGLPIRDKTPLIGLIARLVDQKGIDLLINALPHLIKQDVQLVILGSGEQRYEQQLLQWQQWHPEKISVTIGYDESLAHRIEGSSDMFLMPSRFEPCGLNQLYSLKYGTVPIVRRAGGLADTVIEASKQNIKNRTATGIVFDHADTHAICWALDRAITLFHQPDIWQQLCKTGMAQIFDWKSCAEKYLKLYKKAENFKGL